jgi:hypothetical protein
MMEMNILAEFPIPILLILLGGISLLLGFSGTLRIRNIIIVPPVSNAGRTFFKILGFILIALGIYLLLFSLKNNNIEIIIDEPKGEIFSKDEHVKITVEGRINNFSPGWRAARIYILVEPLEAEGFFTQKQVPASEKWAATTYLGGTGEYSARHGEQFVICAVLTENTLETRYNNLKELPEEKTILSDPVKLRVSRRR